MNAKLSQHIFDTEIKTGSSQPIDECQLPFTYRLFMYQDENENEPEDKSFRSFWIKPVMNEPGLSATIH